MNEGTMQLRETQGGPAAPPGRWYFLDWLRAAALLLVFLFHCGRFFDHLWWHVKDSQREVLFTIGTLLFSHWVMPLFFLIAGAAAGLARQSARGRGSFVRDRLRRLIVPFVFGVLVVVPPQVYFERLSKAEFEGSYLAFYPRYFDGLYFFGGNFSWIGHHLWFLLALFFVGLVAQPLFRRYLDTGSSAARLASLCERLGAPVCFGLPVLVLHLAFRAVGLVDPFSYVLFYLYGVLLAADARFLSAVRRSGGLALLIAVLSSSLYAILFAVGAAELTDLSRYSPMYALLQLLAGLNAWMWPQALLALASARLNRPGAMLRYVNEAGMPFYILHQTVIIGVGHFLLSSSATPVRKFVFIIALAFPTTLALYELFIRRFRLPRLLFGLASSVRASR